MAASLSQYVIKRQLGKMVIVSGQSFTPLAIQARIKLLGQYYTAYHASLPVPPTPAQVLALVLARPRTLLRVPVPGKLAIAPRVAEMSPEKIAELARIMEVYFKGSRPRCHHVAAPTPLPTVM